LPQRPLSEGHRRRQHELVDLDADRLRRDPVVAISSDGAQIHRWSIWKCLVAELEHEGRTYVLDEGEFFTVDTNYLARLNTAIDDIPTSSRPLPPTRLGTKERQYNTSAAAADPDLLFLDFKLVGLPGERARIEVCDLLSADRSLIHVKRDFSSAGLSHLFAQGVTSASVLQESPEFRQRAQARITTEAGERSGSFAFFSDTGLETRSFTVVYGIIGRWDGRSASAALPFFSKVNLREAVTNLKNRDYRIALAPIDATLQNPT
jgi:uncharacterized protein (TIGR04141 family)